MKGISNKKRTNESSKSKQSRSDELKSIAEESQTNVDLAKTSNEERRSTTPIAFFEIFLLILLAIVLFHVEHELENMLRAISPEEWALLWNWFENWYINMYGLIRYWSYYEDGKLCVEVPGQLMM